MRLSRLCAVAAVIFLWTSPFGSARVLAADCKTNDECPVGQSCQIVPPLTTGTCAAAKCSTNADCTDAGSICSNGSCVPGCATDADCATGQSCKITPPSTTGTCSAATPKTSSSTVPTTCDCYCETATDGAVNIGAQADETACWTACDAAHKIKMAMCDKGSQGVQAKTPADSPQCFVSATDCTNNCSDGGKWDDSVQQPDCLAGSHYCYCTGKPAQLEIPINGTTSVTDVGNYIQVVYRYLLGFSIIVAIVMVMIGGLRYLLTAGGSGSVKTAKNQIKNSIVGLVLLFSAALLLQTVNPQLLHLELPRLPAQRKVAIPKSSTVATNQGGACKSDSDCPKYYVCGAGTQTAGQNFTTQSDRTCVPSAYLKGATCHQDSDCPAPSLGQSHQICSVYHCVLPRSVLVGAPCSTDSACISGSCGLASGDTIKKCLPGGTGSLCESHNDCASQYCSNGKCNSCTSDAQCPSGMSCFQNNCATPFVSG